MQPIKERLLAIFKPYKAYIGGLIHEKEKIYKAKVEFPEAIKEKLPYITKHIEMALATRIKCADAILVCNHYGYELRVRFK